jgi:hypothetical protein
MQTPVYTGAPQTQERRWYWTRTIVAGLILVGLAVLYFLLVLPVANAEVPPSNYRFPFSFITLIYAADLTILGVQFFYRIWRPAKTPPREKPVSKLDVLGMVIVSAFMLTVGGSYVSGAAVATPAVFAPILNILPFLGSDILSAANYFHSLFALLIIIFGVAIVVFEITKIAVHKSTWKDWLVKARYPEIKVFYWVFGIAVITQGVLGLFLLGTISPSGPWPFIVGNNSYAFETLIRHIHGPLGALVFALFTNHVYLRVRPEFSIR